MTDAAEYGAVLAQIEIYLDGLYLSDTALLGRVLHPNAHYVTVSGGTLVMHDMPTYFAIVDKRPSPRSRGERRNGETVSIEFAGPKTARAYVRCAFLGRRFDDFLTFIKTEDSWRIISKVFHYVEENA